MNKKSVEAISIILKSGNRYSICSCGLSQSMPYCDNAHRAHNEKEGTNYKSLKIFPKEDTEIQVYSATWER